MSNGLMSLVTGGLGSATEELLGRAKRQEGQIEEGFSEADAFHDTMVSNTTDELAYKRKQLEEKNILGSADNFDRVLAEFGEGQKEELNLLARAKPWLFEGNISDVMQNIEVALMSPTATDISPEGIARVKDVTVEGGYRTLEDKAPDYTYGAQTTGQLWRDNYQRSVANINAGLSDAVGPNTAGLFAGDFIKEPGAKERFEDRKRFDPYQMGAEGVISKEDFLTHQAEIVGRKIYEAPSTVSANEFMRYTNWVDMPSYENIVNAFTIETKGNVILSQKLSMAEAVKYHELYEKQGYDVSQLVKMGVVSNDSIVGIMTSDPAGPLSLQMLREKTAQNPLLDSWKRSYEALPGSELKSSDIDGDGILDAENWLNLVENTYNEARNDVDATGFYSTKKEFLSAFNALEYPSELSLDFSSSSNPDAAALGATFIYPIPSEGWVKIVDGQNPNPESPVAYWEIRNMLPEREGGNPDKTQNIYYNSNFGYNPLNDSNPKLDEIWNTIKINDPFGINTKINLAPTPEDAFSTIVGGAEPETIPTTLPIIEEEAEVATGITQEQVDSLTLPPTKTLKPKTRGGKSSVVTNPAYDLWLSENKELWNASIDYIMANEPEPKFRMTEPKGGKPGKKIITSEWRAWDKKYRKKLEVGIIE